MAVPLLFVFLISLITGHICVRYVRIRDVRVRYSRIYVMSVPFLFVFFFLFLNFRADAQVSVYYVHVCYGMDGLLLMSMCNIHGH